MLGLGAMTLTSHKHGIHVKTLRQASNGHLLLPLCPEPPDLEVAQCEEGEPNQSKDFPSDRATAGDESLAMKARIEKPQAVSKKIIPSDKK